MSNIILPPPPTLDELHKQIPEDFMTDHPLTDRIMNIISFWLSGKESLVNMQSNMQTVINDYQHTLNLLYSVKEEHRTAEINEWLSKFSK